MYTLFFLKIWGLICISYGSAHTKIQSGEFIRTGVAAILSHGGHVQNGWFGITNSMITFCYLKIWSSCISLESYSNAEWYSYKKLMNKINGIFFAGDQTVLFISLDFLIQKQIFVCKKWLNVEIILKCVIWHNEIIASEE